MWITFLSTSCLIDPAFGRARKGQDHRAEDGGFREEHRGCLLLGRHNLPNLVANECAVLLLSLSPRLIMLGFIPCRLQPTATGP